MRWTEVHEFPDLSIGPRSRSVSSLMYRKCAAGQVARVPNRAVVCQKVPYLGRYVFTVRYCTENAFVMGTRKSFSNLGANHSRCLGLGWRAILHQPPAESLLSLVLYSTVLTGLSRPRVSSFCHLHSIHYSLLSHTLTLSHPVLRFEHPGSAILCDVHPSLHHITLHRHAHT